jgi:hypothetical protein
MSNNSRRIFANVLAGIALLVSICAAAQDNQEPGEGNVFGQSTYIWHEKKPFSAGYTNLNGSSNSLVAEKERSYTYTATAFIGLRLWRGGELQIAPEVISELPPSGLRGLGGSFQNGELEKNGKRPLTVYRSRFFLRQTWNLGGESTPFESRPLQLASNLDSRRFVLTAGNFAIIDVFDRNAYAGDVRQQFLNMNFLTYSAFDFEADARGYTWGVAGEYYHDDWAVRAGRFIGPRDPNQLRLNYSIFKYYGDNLEIEHKHTLLERSGRVRVLAYRNVARMGRWDDAINAFAADPTKNSTTCTTFNYGSSNAGAPDLCWVRKGNSKTGIGVSLEQDVSPDVGVFFRGMKSDGKTEVYAFTSTDSSISLGTAIKGRRWGREHDTLGIGFAKNWLSTSHVKYLSMGGIDGFIGDGQINYKPERLFETYYNINMARPLWLTLDFQRVNNPAYNADRGPVTFYGFRLHVEF